MIKREEKSRYGTKLSAEKIKFYSKSYGITEEQFLYHTYGGYMWEEQNSGQFGKNNHMFGQKHSEQTKKLMSEKRKQFCKTPEYKEYFVKLIKSSKKPKREKGRHWFNNGKTSILAFSPPDETWVKGRLFSEEHKRKFFVK